MDPATRQVLLAIAARRSQMEDARQRRYPDGTAREGSDRVAERLRERRERHERERRLSWADLLLEEMGKALTAQPESDELEQQLQQVAALAVTWLEDLRGRRKAREQGAGPPPAGTVLHVRLPDRSLVYRATVLPGGRVKIPALGKVLGLNEVIVQRAEPAAAAPAEPESPPLKPVISAQLTAMKRAPAPERHPAGVRPAGPPPGRREEDDD